MTTVGNLQVDWNDKLPLYAVKTITAGVDATCLFARAGVWKAWRNFCVERSVTCSTAGTETLRDYIWQDRGLDATVWQDGSTGALTLQPGRRFLPTAAALWGAPWDGRVVLGHHSTGSDDKLISTMPHTYPASLLQTHALARLGLASLIKQIIENGGLPTMSTVPRLMDTGFVAAIRTQVASSLEAPGEVVEGPRAVQEVVEEQVGLDKICWVAPPCQLRNLHIAASMSKSSVSRCMG